MLNPYIIERKLIVNGKICYFNDWREDLLDEEEIKEVEQIKTGSDFDGLWDFLKTGVYCCQSMWKRGIFLRKRRITFEDYSITEGKKCEWEYTVKVKLHKHFRIRDLQTMNAEKVLRYCAERGSSIIFEK